MSQAAAAVYQTLRKQGTQQPVIDQMQTRDQLYDVLNYHAYEEKLDALFAEEDGKPTS
jgi:methylisocitrate lyase